MPAVSKKILITGAAGFIGSHLAESLVQKGHHVFGVDNFDPYYSRAIKERNLKNLLQNKNFQFYELDLIQATETQALVKSVAPDLIIHLAAKAGVRPSLERPIDYVRANLEMTTSLLQASVQNKIKRFIFASSSSVYGNLSTAPFKTNEKNLYPISPYGATKLACEQMAYVYAASYGLECIGLRFFTVYGPRQRPDLAIYKFVDKISRGESIDVYGDGSTSRDYTYISDILRGIEGCFDVQLSAAIPFQVYNLGSRNPITLLQMIESIEKVLGQKAKRIQRPEQVGDVKQTFADISDSKALNYEPQFSFEAGLKNFYEWYQEVKNK